MKEGQGVTEEKGRTRATSSFRSPAEFRSPEAGVAAFGRFGVLSSVCPADVCGACGGWTQMLAQCRSVFLGALLEILRLSFDEVANNIPRKGDVISLGWGSVTRSCRNPHPHS
eukprot:TRINITY_DN3316_c0_g1_i1.p2 TRINITY_DN3316_c0_g1~~TRINITY_DN3316_c0_g1_i1.p2  ORF type:complete len:113 (-),score=0.12 TRINITY_DN3316_c0_g1_i1:205-543(-)